jgi:uncharacterized protein YjiK
VAVPLADRSEKPPAGRLLRKFSLDTTDLSDLCYDAVRKRLYIISDYNNLLFIATADGNVLARYTGLPCEDQEGIAFDSSGAMYIAQDSGGIVKIDWPDRP